MSSVDPSKITPEQKKFIDSVTGTSSVATQEQIENAVGGLQNNLLAANEELISSLSSQQFERLSLDQATAGFQRGSSEKSSPIIQGPTRAQDTFSLNQSPTALMSAIPRQKFEYLATFRFYGDDSNQIFEEIFRNEEIDTEISTAGQTLQNFNGSTGGIDAIARQNLKKQHNDLKQSRADAMESLRRSLVFNIKQIDGPKVNFQYDTLNQYNRKRNVYRRVDYDPVNVRFHDTMNNAALKFWKYLYELSLKDGNNRNKNYGGNATFNKGVYQTTPLSSESDFISQHNFGLESSISNNSYPLKSLDLFLIHGRKYNLIRFVHPRVISMDHDVMSYESSAPIEIGLQFAYETIIYETLNYDMGNAKDVTIDFDELLTNSRELPETPTTVDTSLEGNTGTTANDNPDWLKLSTNLSDDITATTNTLGNNLMNSNSFLHNINTAGAAYGGSILQNISTTPVSDAIDSISRNVYNATKSAVSSFSSGDFGSAFNTPSAGAGKYSTGTPSVNNSVQGFVKDANGKIIKDANGNPVRGGTLGF